MSSISRRRLTLILLACIAAVVIAIGVTLATLGFSQQALPKVTPTPRATVTATPTPTVTPDFPANTAVYDLVALPAVDVFAVIPQLPVDDQPQANVMAEVVTPKHPQIPIFAHPTGEPVAYQPLTATYDGTTIPVIERQENWVRVLLAGRQAAPSQGNPGQLTGWLRAADVDFTAINSAVEVSISAHTVDIVRDGVAERLVSDFAWGSAATPTPVGRTFIMTIRTVPQFAYTRGNPIIYLGAQSPTLDGFGGTSVAVTAFHYHDAHSGPISNGCIRMDAAALAKLAELPYGTPVYIRP